MARFAYSLLLYLITPLIWFGCFGVAESSRNTCRILVSVMVSTANRPTQS
jgi:hypothetical protein